MKNFTLSDLYSFKESLSNTDYIQADMDILDQIIQKRINEDSGGGEGSSGGMGDVISAQPSTNAGSLSGSGWDLGGGTLGSGDIGVPINLSATNKTFQKIKSPLGKNHGASTGKKSRVKKLDLKYLRNTMRKKEPGSRVMNFDAFSKKGLLTKVTKVKEGRIFRGSKTPHEDKNSNSDRKEDLRQKVKDFLKSINIEVDRVGNDFLASSYDDNIHVQIMFRDDYISVKESKEKFSEEFKYSEFGKLKSKLSIYFN